MDEWGFLLPGQYLIHNRDGKYCPVFQHLIDAARETKRRLAMRVRRIETVLQWVSDPQASSQWYARLLGITPTPYEVPYFKFAEHAYLLLSQATPGTGRGGTGVWFEVESVDTTYQELQAQGFTFNGPPFDIPPGRLVTLNDPDGNIIGLIDNSKGGIPGQVP
jgi:predicted enzyme related to lactoylglutathione lyase